MPGSLRLPDVAATLLDHRCASHGHSAIARGESAAADEERFKRTLIRRAPALGVIFIVTGILLVLNILRPLALVAFAKLLPVLLILLGGYLLTRYFKRGRDEAPPQPEYSPKPPYSLVPGSFGDRAAEQARRLSRPGQR